MLAGSFRKRIRAKNQVSQRHVFGNVFLITIVIKFQCLKFRKVQTCSNANKRKIKITSIFNSPEIVSWAFWCLLFCSSCMYMCVLFINRNRIFVCAQSLSPVWLFATPWTVAHQAPLPMGFSREEYWSGLPCPSPGHLPNPGIEPRSPALQADSLLSELPGELYLFANCLFHVITHDIYMIPFHFVWLIIFDETIWNVFRYSMAWQHHSSFDKSTLGGYLGCL